MKKILIVLVIVSIFLVAGCTGEEEPVPPEEKPPTNGETNGGNGVVIIPEVATCDSMPNSTFLEQQDQAVCYSKAAAAQKNVLICNNIHEGPLRALLCFTKVGSATKRLSDCAGKNQEEVGLIPYASRPCFILVEAEADTYKTKSQCDSTSGTYSAYAFKKKNVCYAIVAAKTQNIGICNNIDPSYGNSLARDSCYFTYAIMNNNVQACDNIFSTAKDYCKVYMSELLY